MKWSVPRSRGEARERLFLRPFRHLSFYNMDPRAGSGLSSVEEVVVAATKQAEIFVEAFYAAQDSPAVDRPARVQPLYSPTARITWNGNPIPFNDLPAFLTQMPKSLHEVQAFDCHPISGSATGSPPSLVLSVSGQVTHGDSGPPSTGVIHARDYDFLPRVFSQSLILIFDPSSPPIGGQDGQGGTQYRISADSFRFC